MADYGSWRPGEGEEERRRDAGRVEEGICERTKKGEEERRGEETKRMMNGDDMGGGGEDADFNQAGISRSGLGSAGELSSASMVVVVYCTTVVHCSVVL
jgi:hypothetical protein